MSDVVHPDRAWINNTGRAAVYTTQDGPLCTREKAVQLTLSVGRGT